ncbi:aldose 1-epimerase family protein [Flavobacterium sp. K77]|uniref:aldose 1-epimerase family protein n=1 Tax=Flavobacterium sp. K77 TaxID=2910676 RepID=UPI001F3A764F|nr:aldose 1-epimerase family protein [Flavobacterium sp. K77]
MITTLQNSKLTVQIKQLGAELFSITNSEEKEYIWGGDPAIWGKHAPILFPIVGTLKNNTYNFNEQQYQLTRHGFARDMHFDIVQSSKTAVTFSLQADPKTLAVYPFHFELQVSYTLQNATILVDYKVINKGEHSMPFAIGAHPAFALEDNFNDYSLVFEKEETLKYFILVNDLVSDQTKVLASNNKKVALDYDLFANDALIFKTTESKELTIVHQEKPLLKVKYAGFPNLGIWTKINAPFVCIEPWYGYSDTQTANGNLFEKEGMQKLNANQSFTAQYQIEIL